MGAEDASGYIPHPRHQALDWVDEYPASKQTHLTTKEMQGLAQAVRRLEQRGWALRDPMRDHRCHP